MKTGPELSNRGRPKSCSIHKAECKCGRRGDGTHILPSSDKTWAGRRAHPLRDGCGRRPGPDRRSAESLRCGGKSPPPPGFHVHLSLPRPNPAALIRSSAPASPPGPLEVQEKQAFAEMPGGSPGQLPAPGPPPALTVPAAPRRRGGASSRAGPGAAAAAPPAAESAGAAGSAGASGGRAPSRAPSAAPGRASGPGRPRRGAARAAPRSLRRSRGAHAPRPAALRRARAPLPCRARPAARRLRPRPRDADPLPGARSFRRPSALWSGPLPERAKLGARASILVTPRPIPGLTQQELCVPPPSG